MTIAIAPPATASKGTVPPAALTYRVDLGDRAAHYLTLTLTVEGWPEAILPLHFPVWTPGSYLVREYGRHVQEFRAVDGNGQPLAWQKTAKNCWQVTTAGDGGPVRVSYRLFCNELTVRTNHVDGSHAYFNGASTFFFVPPWRDRAIAVTVDLPDGWQATTALDKVAGDGGSQTFLAQNFDQLVDSPFEVGTHELTTFEVLGKTHQIAIWGQGNVTGADLTAEFEQIIETEATLFGGLPYDRYLFLLHLLPQGGGGLEHENCCSLQYPRFGFRDREKRERFMQLVAHEFFHLWNVKRLHPQEFDVFDYEAENYTPSLWFCEGVTSYYDLLLPLRAGIYDRAGFLKHLGKEVTRYLTTPGRFVQPLKESSFDAWVKLYRADAHSGNSQMSYYLKGAMVTLLLDLLIRDRHENQRSFDDVLRSLWRDFGQRGVGYRHDELETAIAAAADLPLAELRPLFDAWLGGTDPLPLEDYLSKFGLTLAPEGTPPAPHLGLRLKDDRGRTTVTFVEAGSPAYGIGLDAGDELLAIAGLRIEAATLEARLRDHQPGDRLTLTWFHQDELRTAEVTLAELTPSQYAIAIAKDAPEEALRKLDGWLWQELGP